tara:strand:- start:242 stop:1414 length:1173 start_codon:yes stop_codon:yes gene_type:complete
MDENIGDYRYSNIEVSNKTKIGNLNFTKFGNIVYVNNVLSTDLRNNLILDKTNTTYVLQNISTFIYKKTISEIKKEHKDIFVSHNHNLKKGDIIKLYNIRRKSPESNVEYINLLNNTLQHTDITYKILTTTRDTFTLTTFGNSTNLLNNIIDIIKTSSPNINDGYFELITSKPLEQNNIVNVNISTSVDTIGSNYNLIINDNISRLVINTLNDDKFVGYINIGNNDMISNDFIEVCENKTTLTISDIDLRYSSFEITNIEPNIWYIHGKIYSNKVSYKITYDPLIEDYKINNNNLALQSFYKKFVYEFDISDPSLENYLFVIVDDSNNNYYKNIIKMGEMGHPNSFIRIYIDNDEVVDKEYTLKYKKNISNNYFDFTPLYIIKNTPIHFS